MYPAGQCVSRHHAIRIARIRRGPDERRVTCGRHRHYRIRWNRNARRRRRNFYRMRQADRIRSRGGDEVIVRRVSGRIRQPPHERTIGPHRSEHSIDRESRVAVADASKNEVRVFRLNQLVGGRINDLDREWAVDVRHRGQRRIHLRNRRSLDDCGWQRGSWTRRGLWSGGDRRRAGACGQSRNDEKRI